MSRSLAAVIAAALLLPGAESIAQQNSSCWLLEQELAAYDNASPGAGSQVERYNQAIARQQNALNTTENHAGRIGCFKRGFLFFQPSKPAECQRLEATIDEMRRNLADLTAQRNRLSGPARPDDPGKQRILRLLAENRCGPQYEQWANVGRSRGLFGSWFEEDTGPTEDYRGGYDTGRRMPSGAATYRTLCVRTCDGYYFPISFSTLPQRFEQDAQQCRSMCPTAVVELYVHENPGGSVEQMVSLSGKPYASIPTAFRYRKEYTQGCSCNRYTLALEAAEAEKEEVLAARTEATVDVPEIVPQGETEPATEGTAPQESEFDPFRGSGGEQNEFDPFGGSGGQGEQGGEFDPFRGSQPQSEFAPPVAPRFSTPREKSVDLPFPDPAADR